MRKTTREKIESKKLKELRREWIRYGESISNTACEDIQIIEIAECVLRRLMANRIKWELRSYYFNVSMYMICGIGTNITNLDVFYQEFDAMAFGPVLMKGEYKNGELYRSKFLDLPTTETFYKRANPISLITKKPHKVYQEERLGFELMGFINAVVDIVLGYGFDEVKKLLSGYSCFVEAQEKAIASREFARVDHYGYDFRHMSTFEAKELVYSNWKFWAERLLAAQFWARRAAQ